jgi:glutamine cyclotransferase
MKRLLLLFFVLQACLCCQVNRSAQSQKPVTLPYTVTRSFPHDSTAFTQGLVLHQGKLYESTGLKGQSWVAEVDLVTGKQDKKVRLPKKYFGEGITILHDTLYQLTWQNKTGFTYDLPSFRKTGEFRYKFEGWGITDDGHHLLISDGSDKIRYVDPATFSTLKILRIRENNRKVRNLNELEFIDSYLFANVWKKNVILQIDPTTATVVGKMDLSPLVREIKRSSPKADALNGIAYNPENRDIIITGKFWPKAYVLRLTMP